ncbi:triple tyrosine motif-containing protein [Haloimpatiens sp. FM7330]|uniref:triple tyrosine motif-containing protein n=1 Tax=Haloimpatiens sp. FM7330 TaxID=3298610 RepID=UPI00362EC398
MNEIDVKCSLESPQDKGKDISLSVDAPDNDNLIYKFLVGKDGTWNTLKDFSNERSISWKPEEDGKYIIMVQAKEKESTKGFDYISRLEYIIGDIQEQKMIKNIYIDKKDIKIGDKITIIVESNKIPVMYRYWIKEDGKWELIKEYSPDNTLNWTVLSSGKQEILVECKNLDSNNNFDDFDTISFDVQNLKKVEIRDFKCLTKRIIKKKELLFQISASYDDNRMILYKFIKIDSMGDTECIQDYSTKRTVNFVENESGEYKLLCLAKDMYSPKEFDDRAVIMYRVKEYEEIELQAFTTDLSSPQICGTPIELKAIAKGGENLVYRFKIEGNRREDSGYIKLNKYIWKPEECGKYIIKLFVKDECFSGEYEVKDEIEFYIDEISKEDVSIKDILYDKKETYLKKEAITVEVIAEGGVELKYGFIVRKNGEDIEKIPYGNCNWVNFTPEESGNFELEVRVKDKYSKRQYDSHEVIPIEARDYIPANIEYVLMSPKETYMVGDNICFDIITQNTNEIEVKYMLKINGHIAEETEFLKNKRYEMIPRHKGVYILDILAKNEKSNEKYDCKKCIKLQVKDCFPVTNTKLRSNKLNFVCNEAINLSVTSEGGKDVVYEFYLMEKGEWILVQKYSKKDYYSYIPFNKGLYKILVLAKSMYEKFSYEDYDVFEFYVE